MTAISERLQPGPLPVFRHTHDAFSGFSVRRDQIGAREIANDLLLDPLATLYLLHLINLRVGERSGTEVSTVEHALMMHGIGAFLDAAKRWPILEAIPAGYDPRVLAALQTISRRAQHASWQARDFAVLHSDVRAEEVQVAALLHYAPELLLWLRMPEQAIALQRKRRSMPGIEAETAVLGMPLAELRENLLRMWNIPPLLLDMMNDEYGERTRNRILQACLDIAERSDRGWWDEALLADYESLAGVEHIELDSVIATVHANSARAARQVPWLPVPPAAAWGPMLPGTWPPEPDDDEAETPASAPKPAPAAIPVTAAAQIKPMPAVEPEHAVCPMPDKHVFRDALKGIEEHLDGSLTLNQMSAVILKGLHAGLGLSRIIFAMITPDGTRVKSRFTLGISADDPLRHFEFELAGKDLFAQLMGKMQGVWMSESNRAKLWPMLSPRLQNMLGNGDFYTMSLFNGNKAIGLIYADRGTDGCGLDPLTYTDFKMLCLQAARGLSKVRAPV
jgi:hypothetical protein